MPAHRDCSGPSFHQFDFWLGTWKISWPGGEGINRIEKSYNGCVILEHFDATPSLQLVGMSVSTYDRRIGRWRQTWVDNFGNYIVLSGGPEDGKFILTSRPARDGSPLLWRKVFEKITGDSFEWSWQKSEDAGETWETLWRIEYKRVGP